MSGSASIHHVSHRTADLELETHPWHGSGEGGSDGNTATGMSAASIFINFFLSKLQRRCKLDREVSQPSAGEVGAEVEQGEQGVCVRKTGYLQRFHGWNEEKRTPPRCTPTTYVSSLYWGLIYN